MVRVALAAAALSLTVGAGGVPVGHAGHGYRSSRPWLSRVPVITAPTGEELVADDALPKGWDWRDVNGRNFVTSDVNQHIPQYCGSCWIHGTTAALNDRIKVLRNAAWPDVMLGRQALINCVPDPTSTGPPPGCDGGDPYMIHQYLLHTKIPDETCLPYQARNMGCSPENVCRNCAPEDVLGKQAVCYPVLDYTGYGVSNYGNLSGEVQMMKEIYARGPIVCSAATDDAFMLNYSANAELHEGVYVTDHIFEPAEVDHNIEVVGWGETASGLKYWAVRNSWGTYWGEMGWFKIRRGVNQMLIEADCDWAVPEWDQLDKALDGVVMGDYVQGVQPVRSSLRSPAAPAVSTLAVLPVTLAANAANAADAQPSLLGMMALAAFAGFATALGLVTSIARLPSSAWFASMRQTWSAREPAFEPLLASR